MLTQLTQIGIMHILENKRRTLDLYQEFFNAVKQLLTIKNTLRATKTFDLAIKLQTLTMFMYQYSSMNNVQQYKGLLTIGQHKRSFIANEDELRRPCVS